MRRCDVIIPCYNNQAVIQLTLHALVQQTIPASWEARVIVVDDGSTDETLSRATNILQASNWSYEIIRQTHAGISQARNRGLAAATGTIVVFINADIVLQTGTLAQHLQFHQEYSEITQAALGFITWDPRIKPSPLMEWLTHGGPQNNFDAVLGQTTTDPRHFFTAAHSSVKRQLLLTNQFASEFTQYGWEDIELGRRLGDQGMELHLLHQAVAWHHHYYSVAAVKQRQVVVGQGLHIYQQLHPDVVLLPSHSVWRPVKHSLFDYTGASWLLDHIITLIAERYSWPWLFQLWTSWYFWEGLRAKKRPY